MTELESRRTIVFVTGNKAKLREVHAIQAMTGSGALKGLHIANQSVDGKPSVISHNAR